MSLNSKALPSGINHSLKKSKNNLEFGQKAAGFLRAMMNISYVKEKPFMVTGMTRKLKIHSIGI
jgi:hypothetical protein